MAPAQAPAPQPPAPQGHMDAISIVTRLVAEKTGYPSEMLDADMDLEGELGVDSIKQVEIISALRQAHPDLPEVEPERLAELRTIRQVADFIGADSGLANGAAAGVTGTPAPAPAPGPAPVQAPDAPPETASTPPGGIAVNADTVRALIAEKTGYPAEMLEDDMDLEGELGIDSIKQVEILSALREAHPQLPEIEPEQLAELRTIGQIAGFFH